MRRLVSKAKSCNKPLVLDYIDSNGNLHLSVDTVSEYPYNLYIFDRNDILRYLLHPKVFRLEPCELFYAPVIRNFEEKKIPKSLNFDKNKLKRYLVNIPDSCKVSRIPLPIEFKPT